MLPVSFVVEADVSNQEENEDHDWVTQGAFRYRKYEDVYFAMLNAASPQGNRISPRPL
jgi:hypothetical protein